jgi:hypothetical protein
MFTRQAEYRVDFLLTVNRALEPFERRIFDLRVKGLDWKRGGLNKGEFFHHCYRLEARAGLALVESGIFPPDRYFGGLRRSFVLVRDRGVVPVGSVAWRGRPPHEADWGGPVMTHSDPERRKGLA